MGFTGIITGIITEHTKLWDKSSMMKKSNFGGYFFSQIFCGIFQKMSDKIYSLGNWGVKKGPGPWGTRNSLCHSYMDANSQEYAQSLGMGGMGSSL